ncbi:hypothetical protein FZD47_20920 [Bacillus infantis]|uniref:DUF3854 domain-containing protein n=1 Tax=Bacillus infantis TaxID=324767 RepID=A0A5D4SEZ2_9BACI|nr:hypothetical protein [Bacillus infantis]TYS60674.1 hypothetical protein FZD47_20920 [Bacillus infantis]
MKKWFEYYRETCPICGKRGGCMINGEGDTVVCIRTESDIQFSKGFPSWIHKLKEKRDRRPSEDSKADFMEGHEKQDAAILNQTYRGLLSVTTLNGAHYTHLSGSSRQMTETEIVARQYRSFPEKPWNTVKQLKRALSVDDFCGIPGFFENKYGWSLAGRQGILIPYRNELNQIVGFQTRIDNPPNDVEITPGSIKGLQVWVKEQPNLVQICIDGEIVEEANLPLGKTHNVYTESGMGFVKLVKGQRYFWLSSAKKHNGTGAGGAAMPVHVAVPSNKLAGWTPGTLKKAKSVWFTEGALKADIAVEHLAKVYKEEELEKLGTTFLATAGVNTWRSALPVLKAMETEHINVAVDMDAMQNPKVAYHLKQMLIEFKNLGYSATLVYWNPEDGKAIDDIFIKRKFPNLKKLF